MKRGKVEGTVINKHPISQRFAFLKFYKKPQRWFRPLVLVSVFALLLFAFNPNPAAAANFYWIGGHTGTPNAWNDALNWSASSGGGGGVGVPGSSDTAIFDSASAVNCTLTVGVVVGSITNSNYTRILALSTYALTVNGDLTWNAGTISAGSSTITVAGNLNTSGSTFTYSTSTIVMTGTAKTITNGSTAYYNLTISGNVSTASSDLVILNNLTVDTNKVLSIANSQKVTLGPDLTLTLNGTIDGDGTLYIASWSSKTLPSTGTINVNVEINQSTVTIPGRDFGKDLTLSASSTSTTNFGTTSDQTINIGGNFSIVMSTSTQTFTVNASAYNPNINISGIFKSDYYGTCYSKVTLNLGNGTWVFRGDASICGALNAGNSTIIMDGTSNPNLWVRNSTGNLYNVIINKDARSDGYSGFNVSHHLEIANSTKFVLQNDIDVSMMNGSTVTNNGEILGDTGGSLVFWNFVSAPAIEGSGEFNTTIKFLLSGTNTETYIPARTYTNRVWFQNSSTTNSATFHLGTDVGQTLQFRDIIVDSTWSYATLLDAALYNPNVIVTDDIETRKQNATKGQGSINMGSGTWTLNQRMNIAAEHIDQQTATVNYQKFYPTQTRIGSIGGDYGNAYASTLYNEKIIIGGNFTDVNGTGSRSVAFYDPTNGWQAMGDGLDGGPVNALLTKDNNVYACGWFDNSGSTPINAVAKWDGSSWSQVGTNLPSGSLCDRIDVINDHLYITGEFYSFNNDILWYDQTSDTWQELTNDPTQYVKGDGWISFDLIYFQDEIYIGGTFDLGGGTVMQAVASWDGQAWTVRGEFDSAYSMPISLIEYENKLIAGGDFVSVNGTSAVYVATWDGINWSGQMHLADTDFSTLSTGVFGFTLYNGELVAYGEFTTWYQTINDTNNLAIWRDGTWQQLRNENIWVNTVMQYCNDLLIGGWNDFITRSPIYLYSPDGEPIQYCEAGEITPTPTPTADPALTSTPTANPALTSTPAPTVSSTTGAASTSGVLSDILPATGKSTPDKSHNLFYKIELFILEKITLQFHY